MSNARFILQNGKFNKRRIPRSKAGVVALETVARLEKYEAREGTKTLFNALYTDLKEVNTQMLAHAEVEKITPSIVELPSDLLLLESEEVLRSNFLLNTALDSRFRQYAEFLRSAYTMYQGMPEGEAAGKLLDKTVGDNDGFLKAASKEQFWELKVRLDRLGEVESEIALLNLGEATRQMVALNDFFGATLGVTKIEENDKVLKDPVLELISRLESLMVQLVCFLNVAHPAEGDEELIASLLKPYLEAIMTKTRRPSSNNDTPIIEAPTNEDDVRV